MPICNTLPVIIAGSVAPAAVLAVPSSCTAAEVRSQSNENAPDDVTTVENFGGVSASQVSRGLGFNINPSNEWEFRMAAEAGAVEGRVQFSWEAVENISGDLALSGASETALDRFAQYNLEPLIVAAYGPPRRRILTVTVAADVPAGSYVIPVSEDVSSVDAPFCHLQRSSGAQIVADGKWAYYGAHIHAFDADNRTLTLAARTNVAWAAGDALAINRLSYPSVATTDPNDLSIAAYARYAQFLASRVDAHGLAGPVASSCGTSRPGLTTRGTPAIASTTLLRRTSKGPPFNSGSPRCCIQPRGAGSPCPRPIRQASRCSCRPG